MISDRQRALDLAASLNLDIGAFPRRCLADLHDINGIMDLEVHRSRRPSSTGATGSLSCRECRADQQAKTDIVARRTW